jgi:hypothetical protein
VPHTATTAFVAKMQRWLAASPVSAFRVLGKNINANVNAPITTNVTATIDAPLSATMRPAQESSA